MSDRYHDQMDEVLEELDAVLTEELKHYDTQEEALEAVMEADLEEVKERYLSLGDNTEDGWEEVLASWVSENKEE
jgi:ElaB/YqjD/DUF883 family membrane-anchored ribosome-binding protein